MAMYQGPVGTPPNQGYYGQPPPPPPSYGPQAGGYPYPPQSYPPQGYPAQGYPPPPPGAVIVTERRGNAFDDFCAGL
ncbi:hypothetical protein CLOM_g10947 [Closterium sp. NIES-68]|nr:hypothetical protein CLOM_g10947 [Closterium sp. NIES-68]GJP57814.1 hypothetical protein CLOP_g17404 [Closterium sp. NIES-67]